MVLNYGAGNPQVTRFSHEMTISQCILYFYSGGQRTIRTTEIHRTVELQATAGSMFLKHRYVIMRLVFVTVLMFRNKLLTVFMTVMKLSEMHCHTEGIDCDLNLGHYIAIYTPEFHPLYLASSFRFQQLVCLQRWSQLCSDFGIETASQPWSSRQHALYVTALPVVTHPALTLLSVLNQIANQAK